MGKGQSSGKLSEASGVDRLWYPAIRMKSDMPTFVQWWLVNRVTTKEWQYSFSSFSVLQWAAIPR